MQKRYRCTSAVALRDGIYSTRHLQVVEAYLKPAVDHDDQPCKWERPDLHGAHQSAGL